jgi:hypothetical protein
MADDANRFRKQAEGCRQHAARAVGPVEKEQWHRLSEEWLKLAQATEASQQRPPQRDVVTTAR